MTDWIQDIKTRGKESRKRAEINRQAIDMHGPRLWRSLFDLCNSAVQEFNRGHDQVIDLTAGDPLDDFTYKVRGKNQNVKVWYDAEHAQIGYSYRNITNARAGQFYLESSPDGIPLLICPSIPCDESIEVDEAMQRVLTPLFVAAA